MESPTTYSLSISFTRNGITSRVPWVFVLYSTSSHLGLRLRAKVANEISPSDLATTSNSPIPKHVFLARENAYVDNFRCHGRVIIRTDMTQAERDAARKIIEEQELSLMIDGQRDCQKWVTECLPTLGFDEEFVRFWVERRGENIWEIERAVDGKELKFLRGPAYALDDRLE